MCFICERIDMIKNNTNPYFVKELDTGYVVIGDNQHFKGYTLFLCKQHKTELFYLDTSFQVLKNKVVNYPLKSDKMVNAQINQVSLKGSNSHGYIIHQIADDNQVKKSIL